MDHHYKFLTQLDDKLPQVWGDRDSRHLQDWMEIWLCTRDELRMTI